MQLNGCPGLILPGGGARGAYQVGVLKALSAVLDTDHLPFRCVSGVSAGSINAAALVERADNFADGVHHLEQIWNDMRTGDVFEMEFDALQSFLGTKDKPRSLLDNAPLGRMLERSLLGPGAVEAQIQAGLIDGFAVSASSYSSGQSVTFFQARKDLLAWHGRRREAVATAIGIDHLMASSALPVLFPAQAIGKEYFVDGSLRMTQPLSPVIKMGADRILVVGVRNETMPADDYDVAEPGIAEVAGYMLDSLFSENMNADVERMEDVNRLIDRVPWWRRRKLGKRHIRVLVVRPSQDLRTIAARFSVQLPRGIRFFLRTVGGWGHEWRMPSYLLFEGAFARELIDLGYRDGLKLRPQIEQFFA